MVLAFCAENPFLPVLSLHRFLDHSKSLYFLSGPTTIALLLLVCIIPPVLVLPNFWKIFWFFLAFCLQLVPISSFVVTYVFIWMLSVAILQCCSLSQCVSGPTHILGHTLDVLISPCDSHFAVMLMCETLSQSMLPYDANSIFPTQQPALKKWSLIIGIIELISTSSTMTLEIYHLYCPLEELRQNCMISIWLVLPRYLTNMPLSSHA